MSLLISQAQSLVSFLRLFPEGLWRSELASMLGVVEKRVSSVASKARTQGLVPKGQRLKALQYGNTTRRTLYKLCRDWVNEEEPQEELI